MTSSSPTSTYGCIDCKLTISKCNCDTIDICKKTDMIMAFFKWGSVEHLISKGDKKLRNEFFEHFKPKPKIKFIIKKKQVDCADCMGPCRADETESCENCGIELRIGCAENPSDHSIFDDRCDDCRVDGPIYSKYQDDYITKKFGVEYDWILQKQSWTTFFHEVLFSDGENTITGVWVGLRNDHDN